MILEARRHGRPRVPIVPALALLLAPTAAASSVTFAFTYSDADGTAGLYAAGATFIFT